MSQHLCEDCRGELGIIENVGARNIPSKKDPYKTKQDTLYKFKNSHGVSLGKELGAKYSHTNRSSVRYSNLERVSKVNNVPISQIFFGIPAGSAEALFAAMRYVPWDEESKSSIHAAGIRGYA